MNNKLKMEFNLFKFTSHFAGIYRDGISIPFGAKSVSVKLRHIKIGSTAVAGATTDLFVAFG